MHAALASALRLGRPLGRAALAALVRAGPYAAVLALALGLCLALGSNLSNSYPSEQKPFGWPGPASFDAGVATVRPQLILAASVPAVVLGAQSLNRLRPGRDGPLRFGAHVLGDAALLGVATFAAGGIGAWAASRTNPDSYVAFSVAHLLLALAWYALGVLFSVLSRRHGLAAALGAWGLFAVLYENFVRWRVFREAGRPAISSGALPAWFYTAQVFSPIACYRGVLILWRKGFRDYEERAVLDKAALPPWVTSSNFAVFMVVVWIVLPLAVALLGWWLLGKPARQPKPAAAPGAAEIFPPSAFQIFDAAAERA